jgi:signal peptidase I
MSEKKMDAKERVIAEIKDLIIRLMMLIVMLVLLFGVMFGLTSMKNDDMIPRISSGDLILYYRLEQNFRPQDVVVLEKDGKQYVGRIVARGGDSVEVTNQSELRINGSLVFEDEIYYPTPQYDNEITYPMELSDKEYFILGDYRTGAKDSRFYGPVTEKEIKGKVLAVLRRTGL